MTEVYINDIRYHFEAGVIARTLNELLNERIERYPAPLDTAEIFMRVHVALRGSRLVDLGEPRVSNSRVEPTHHVDLVDALAALVIDPASPERIDHDDVKLVLVEHAVFPVGARPTTTASTARSTVQEEISFRASLEAFARLGGADQIARQHIDAFRADHQRQVEAVVAALPDHLTHT
ncbi:hypothetical protein HR059_03500 [Sinorhizobium meliloti WSM1022]|uniref:hypothetical protein n=1 Tax=Rhizobium meliloti TaxID=382 RepID=UPI0004888EFD|nr:hypothetical protein [Sinorhizobium meliloti]MDW9841130.1 hypothetical protein [Sinorhizobium meliloti]QKN13565.1 hypothetical protein HR059_03500 [Sinorhizobium meliloti WSM1022]